MKTNLDKYFKTDGNLEKDGVWFTIDEGTGFLTRRFGGHNSSRMKQAMAKYYKPYAHQVKSGTLSDEKENEIMTRIFVEACLVDWKGVEIDGKPAKFEKETAYKMLLKMPDLRAALQEHATGSEAFKEEIEELGKS